jgi:hypothetical protein
MLEQMARRDEMTFTVVIPRDRTMAISLADKDTRRDFIGKQIFGIVENKESNPISFQLLYYLK